MVVLEADEADERDAEQKDGSRNPVGLISLDERQNEHEQTPELEGDFRLLHSVGLNF